MQQNKCTDQPRGLLCFRICKEQVLHDSAHFICDHIRGGPQGFWGSGKKGYLFSGSWGALLNIFGELGSKHILLGI